MKTLAIGIDPGVNTGFAVWDVGAQAFTRIDTLRAAVAMEAVRALVAGGQAVHLIVEDCRDMYVPRERYDSARLQGVGSVKRDVGLWMEFAELHDIPIDLPKPGRYRKVSASDFRAWTKWEGRTSEHARAAAMQVFQMRAHQLVRPGVAAGRV